MDTPINSQSTDANKTVVRRYLEGVPYVLDELADPDLTIIAPGMTTMRGLKNVKRFSAPYFAALSERRFTAEEMIVEENNVAVRWTIRLTTKFPVPLLDGSLMPPGRTVTESGLTICPIRDGKVLEEFTYMDWLGIFKQGHEARRQLFAWTGRIGDLYKTYHIFFLNTIVAFLFGLGLLLFPDGLLSLFGVAASPAYPARALLSGLLGAALIGIGATAWLLRKGDSRQTLPIMRGILSFDLIALIVSAGAILGGIVNALGWIVLALFLFFAVARVYFGFLQPQVPLVEGYGPSQSQ